MESSTRQPTVSLFQPSTIDSISHLRTLPSCLIQLQKQLLFLELEHVQVHSLKMLEIKLLLKHFAQLRRVLYSLEG